jgi:hypothetical protein
MTVSSEQLWELYREWKTLTEQEGAAILASDWTLVRESQTKKQQLQIEIVHATDLVKADSRSEPQMFDDRLRHVVNELILLETQNSAVLAHRLKGVEGQRRELEATSGRLRRLHTTYVPRRSSVWENVS